MSKNCQKWPKNVILKLVCRTTSLDMAGISEKKITNNGAVTFSKNNLSRKVLVHKLNTKMHFSNQMLRFFSHQYLRKQLVKVLIICRETTRN